jgi:hypothetical protein
MRGNTFVPWGKSLTVFWGGALGFDPASAPLGAGASRWIEHGGRWRADFVFCALRAMRDLLCALTLQGPGASAEGLLDSGKRPAAPDGFEGDSAFRHM